MIVHIFRGSASVYGLTQHLDGANLPKDHGPWAKHSAIEMTPGEVGRIGIASAQAMADIETQGYHLSKTEIRVTRSGTDA